MKASSATGQRPGSPGDPIVAHSPADPARDAGSGVRAEGRAAGANGSPLPAATLNGQSPVSASAESNLLIRAQQGDRAAFGQFVLATQDRLYNLLLRIVGDHEEAKELAQDAYLKSLQALPSFRGNAAPYTWLYRIAVNLAIARLRKVRRHRVFSLDGPGGHNLGRAEQSAEDSPAATILARERGRQVLAALGRLDSEYRAVLVMRDVDGLDYKDISEVLELPLGTVKSRIFRARLAFREELQRYFGPTAGSAGLGANNSADGVGGETP